ncbi:uncharacterized protein DUF2797 [Winogradskyella epiphytica]|uniref:Uncharacterized protein DUF2797 n=1 Tax=Winogradskyella epiphytica TaxID=262005 RepID=A0A2V4XY34_9FLAO|nr:DUF2797 domain-containing protein [Winogradskyella epiphytica]PYE80658.1 uncharacterized protein DUF2797 [Winogradskyella epiphytica]GGW67512.1 hypothetical protein GCM10008085_19200 [Winogradskyella epiphytica]
MVYTGVLTKMQTEFLEPIQYYLVFENDFIHINQLLNKSIDIKRVGYQCLSCGLDRPIFRQGFCKTCFFEKPLAGDWIMRPELSTAHLGKEDRDLEYEKKVQLQPHIVYLANSSNVKVGVTRKSQVPTRWIDQGAHEALEIVEVPNRYLAGITEVALKDHVADKTNWRTMLKNEIKDEDLLEWKQSLKKYIPEEALPYFIENNKETHLHFPVEKYPEKLKSLNLTKTPHYSGKLVGIKGQYLIFEDNTVFNVRSNEGAVVELQV